MAGSVTVTLDQLPKTPGGRSPGVTLALPTFDRGRCEAGVKIKSSFKMCSGFFKYKLIFTCESVSLLVPLSLASSRLAASLSLIFKHLSSEVPRT